MEESNDSKFSYNLEKDFEDLFKFYKHSLESADVIICCMDDSKANKLVYTRAHKIILSAASPMIKAILDSNIGSKNSSFIYLAGISPCSLSCVLNYLYNGKVLVPKENIESFTKAAELLQIKLVEAEASVKSEFLANNAIGCGIEKQVQDKLNIPLMQPKIETNANWLTEPNVISSPPAAINENLDKVANDSKENAKSKATKSTEKKAKPPKLNTKEKSTDVGGAKTKASSPSKKESGPVDPAIAAAASAVWKEWKEIFTKSDDKGFHCLKCPEVKTFTMVGNLNRHYKQSHEQTCKFCKAPFLNEDMLQNHIEAKHTFKCLTCDKSFTMKGNLQRHQKQGCNGANSANALLSPILGTIANTNKDETKVKSKKIKKEVSDTNNNEVSAKTKKVKKEKLDVNNNESIAISTAVKQEVPANSIVKGEPEETSA